jgi:anti-sigma B factor antagonist
VLGIDFNVRASNDGVIVEVTGEVDLATAPLLEDALVSAPPGLSIIVDLAHVTFLDARGVAALITAQRHIQTHGGSLRIRNAIPHVAYVIEITGLGPLLR